MSLEDLYTEIHALQLEIEENEKKFDDALTDTPSQVELARSIYKVIKLLERKLTDLRIHFDQRSSSS